MVYLGRIDKSSFFLKKKFFLFHSLIEESSKFYVFKKNIEGLKHRLLCKIFLKELLDNKLEKLNT